MQTRKQKEEHAKRGVDVTITDVRVRRLSQEGKLRAIVSVTFNAALAVHDIKVIEGRQGLFVAMPSRRNSDGEYRDIAHPINQECRQMLESHVLQAYKQCLAMDVEEAHIDRQALEPHPTQPDASRENSAGGLPIPASAWG